MGVGVNMDMCRQCYDDMPVDEMNKSRINKKAQPDSTGHDSDELEDEFTDLDYRED